MKSFCFPYCTAVSPVSAVSDVSAVSAVSAVSTGAEVSGVAESSLSPPHPIKSAKIKVIILKSPLVFFDRYK
jgi:hypothetical protein